MNLACTHCAEKTIARKWLVYATMLPFIFIFLQIKCGRCKKEQDYDLNLNVFIDFILSYVISILFVIFAIYAFIYTNGNRWLIGLSFFLFYLVARSIILFFLWRKYVDD